MTEDERHLFDSFQEELEKCYKIANRLDSFNPELDFAFTGTPSERIIRQLRAQDVSGFSEMMV